MNAIHPAAQAAPSTTLHYLPVGLFGAVMGSIGLALAWRLAAGAFPRGGPLVPPLRLPEGGAAAADRQPSRPGALPVAAGGCGPAAGASPAAATPASYGATRG